MSIVFHFKNTDLFKTNFTHDIELYINPNLGTQTLSKQHPYIRENACN